MHGLGVKVQYENLPRALSKVNEGKEKASHDVILPSEMSGLNAREEKVHHLDAQMQFISVFKEAPEEQVEAIKELHLQRMKILVWVCPSLLGLGEGRIGSGIPPFPPIPRATRCSSCW